MFCTDAWLKEASLSSQLLHIQINSDSAALSVAPHTGLLTPLTDGQSTFLHSQLLGYIGVIIDSLFLGVISSHRTTFILFSIGFVFINLC